MAHVPVDKKTGKKNGNTPGDKKGKPIADEVKGKKQTN